MKKIFLVNGLVGEYFLSRPEGRNFVVHHKNGNKLENLEWATRKRNVEEWWKQRTNFNKVEQRDEYGELVKVWGSVNEIVKKVEYGIVVKDIQTLTKVSDGITKIQKENN